MKVAIMSEVSTINSLGLLFQYCQKINQLKTENIHTI